MTEKGIAPGFAVRRPHRADARRNFDALLAAAREAFAENGAEASLEDIARRAGVGIGTLYRNFPTRQDLFDTVYVGEVEALCRAAEEVAGLPPWEALVVWLRRFVAYSATKRAISEALNRDSEMFRSCRAAMYAAGEPLLVRAQEAGRGAHGRRLRRPPAHGHRHDLGRLHRRRTARARPRCRPRRRTGPVSGGTPFVPCVTISRIARSAIGRSHGVARPCRRPGVAPGHVAAARPPRRSRPRPRARRLAGRTPSSNGAARSAHVPAGATLGGCPAFPADNVWNADVSHLPVSSRSGAYVASIGAGAAMHADFGAGSWQGATMGFSVAYVKSGQPPVKVGFDYASESDRVGYPIPRDAPVEGGPDADGDRHVLVVNTGTCKLYELFAARRTGATWHAGSGAVFDLRSDHLRPAGWTSADAAGLPITPGLVRRDEVRRGRIAHALRITVPRTAARYVWPARHSASGATSASLPPMGLRLRLKAGFRISGYPRDVQVILRALKTYGAIVADNGSAWYLERHQRPGLEQRRTPHAGGHPGRRLRGGRHQRAGGRPRLREGQALISGGATRAAGCRASGDRASTRTAPRQASSPGPPDGRSAPARVRSAARRPPSRRRYAAVAWTAVSGRSGPWRTGGWPRRSRRRAARPALVRPPVSAIATRVTVATSTVPAVTISSTPWRNRISSSRAWTAARRAEGRPCRPVRPAARTAWLAGGAPA